MSQRKTSTVPDEAFHDTRGSEEFLHNPLVSDPRKDRPKSPLFETLDEPLGEPYQKLRESPAPVAVHPHRRLSERSRLMFARKMHEMGEEEPEELLLL
ncbi:hypothetical protein BJX64DRAFT_258613 [Aspergillus heterothallicus]